MPGYEAAQRIARDAPAAMAGSVSGVIWNDDGRAFEYRRNGKRYRYDVAQRRAAEVDASPPRSRRRAAAAARPTRSAPDRGRQFESTLSPDGTLKAFYTRSQRLAERGRRHRRARDHHRRQRRRPHQVRHRELGVRRGTEPAHGDVVVARQPEARLLPLRRARRARLLRRAEPDAGPGDARHRGVPDGRHRRIPSSICSSTTSPAGSRCASTCATASRSTTRSSATTSTAWRGRADGRELLFLRTNRRQNVMELAAANPRHGRVPRRAARGVADRLAGRRAAHAVSRRRPALHLGVAAQRLEQFLSLRSQRPADRAAHLVDRRSRRTSWSRSTSRPASSSTRRATATTR